MTQVDLGSRPVDAREDAPGRSRRRWLLAAGVLLVAGAALGFGLWWRWLYSAHVLQSGGGLELRIPRPVGTTFYSPPMVFPEGRDEVTVDMRAVSPRIVENTADATIAVLVCHRNNEISHMGSDDLSFCSSTKSFVPGQLSVGIDDPGTNSIILAITTHKLGVVIIDGVHVSYRQGLRHGSQDTGGRVVVRAVQPAPPKPPVTKPPTVTAVTPAAGATAGGTRVVIRGTNFTDTATVRFGTVEIRGKQVSPVSRRQLVVLAPAHVAGTVDVRVVTARGVSPVIAADHFTYR